MRHDAWFHRIKAAQRDLIRMVGGIERAAEISSVSKSHVGRMNNATDPELMPISVVFALESECGVPLVTSAMAELNGRRLADPDAERAADWNVLASYTDVVRKAADLTSGGAMAIADMVVTPAEAHKMDRDAAELQRGIGQLRQALAAVIARGGERVGLHLVKGELRDGTV
ncbi:hypothetical protein NAC44_08025 [Allorhizobium sp. BGMRC 0089]|uniref:hypothetical protein n=1 Tax=Allorhizobium sonneratiae TaxID=2934936 RepID=UPI0020342DEE|nr:hypothetical protein [Allorhizobium sonneratiae]MCM2292273.1 hypothetical protein [Allorhizobium sonneratiae]